MTTETKTSKRYPYAVLDGNEAPDTFRLAESCHMSLAAAKRERDRLNRGDANSHYYVVDWNAARWAKARPNDDHYGAIE